MQSSTILPTATQPQQQQQQQQQQFNIRYLCPLRRTEAGFTEDIEDLMKQIEALASHSDATDPNRDESLNALNKFAKQLNDDFRKQKRAVAHKSFDKDAISILLEKSAAGEICRLTVKMLNDLASEREVYNRSKCAVNVDLAEGSVKTAEQTYLEAHKAILDKYEHDIKKIPLWKKFRNAIFVVFAALAGFVAGAAIGFGIGVAAGAFTPVSFATGVVGMIAGAASGAMIGVTAGAAATGVGLGIASGVMLFKPKQQTGLNNDALDAVKVLRTLRPKASPGDM